MEIDEGLTTKLWLEEHDTKAEAITTEEKHYRNKKINLSKSSRQFINDYCKHQHSTWKILIHAAWGCLLNRLSTSDFIRYGSGKFVGGKSTIKIELPLVFIDSLINEKLSAKKYIDKIHQCLDKKNKHSLALPDDLRYLLLLKATRRKVKNTETLDAIRFPLVLVTDKDSPAHTTLYYNHRYFSTENINNIETYLVQLIDELCQYPKKKMIHLTLLTTDEQEKILTQWSKPTYTLKKPYHENAFITLFDQISAKKPDNLAISYNDTHVTYRELNQAASSIAKKLSEKNITVNDRICVMMDRTPELIMSMIALFKVGAIYVPINPKFPDDRINYILLDSDAKYILTDSKDKVPEQHQTKIITINTQWDAQKLAHPATKFLLSQKSTNLNNIAYIIYTSGTTGTPKGVMIKQMGMCNIINWYEGYFNINENDRSLQFASQGFDTFICETIPYLAIGASVHIVEDNIKLTPSLFFNWLEKQKITICDLPTAYAQMLFAMKWPDTLSIRMIKIGGEAVSNYPDKTLPFDIWNGYGPTEVTVEATYYQLYTANTPPHKNKSIMPPPIGKPIVNFEAYIVDRYLQLLPGGIAGELLIGGPGISPGYVNRDELTNEKFIVNPFNPKATSKLYRTGDLARWLSDGNIQFIGRKDHQIKIRGYRIELEDVETSLSQHPDVNEVVVIAKEKLNGEKSLIAYISPNLEKQRYLYQARCLLSTSTNQFMETTTEDISKRSEALSGVNQPIDVGHFVQLHLRLPGFTESKLLSGHVVWRQPGRCGIAFDLNAEEKSVLEKSIDYYLSTHNVMELVLNTAAKRSLRKALSKKLPEYMVPTTFVTLLQFPLTFSCKIDVKALPPPENFEQLLRSENIPPKSPTEKKLAAIWSDLLGKKHISMTDNFFDLGGNSLTAADLSIKILNQFSTSVPTKILFDLPYIPILAQYIESDGKHYATESFIQEEIDRDQRLSDLIVPTNVLSKNLSNPKHILLTGAGGFLGVYLLRELLKDTDAIIHCFVRKGEIDTAAQRLIATINKFNLNKDISLTDNKRVVIISSDISLDRFGLSTEHYEALARKIDLVYHCGAQVNIMAAYNKLRGSNVQGTIEVIKFATTFHDKPIHYISTLSSAYKKDELGNLIEDYHDENYGELFGGYAISKWVSERLLTEISHRGLPIAIYRSGYIFGQSDNGVTSLNDALLMLIKGCVQLGHAPTMREKITILPVDFVSKATVKISLAERNRSAVYHIDHPTGIMWSDLITWLNDYGYTIKFTSMKEWKKMLTTISHDNALYPFLPYYLAMPDEVKAVNVDTQKAAAMLKALHIDYPEINDQLLTIYFDYLAGVGFLPASKREDKSQAEALPD